MDNQYNYVDNNSGKQTNFGDVACIIGFSVAILTFCCDPFYIFTLVAVIFSVLGLCMANKNKGFAVAGLIISAVGVIVQIIVDIVTLGAGLFF